MLRLILGKDWVANRERILHFISQDVREEKAGRILMVPELISHDMERRLCAAAGDTASRFAEVLSFTRLARRVSEEMGRSAEEALDAGGRVVAMASCTRQLASRLKAYASVETRPEFLGSLIDGVDEFKRCCISAQDLMAASRQTEGSLSQKLEELSLILDGYDALCRQGKRDPRDQETLLLEQMEMGDFARRHVFYIDGFPDFTRQHLAILEHLIKESPCVTVSMNCDGIASSRLAFEKAGNTAQEILRCARRAGVEVCIEQVPEREDHLKIVRESLFQGPVSSGEASACLQVFRADSAYQECMAAAEQIMELVRRGARYRDIMVVCADLPGYQNLVQLIFHRCQIPVYLSGTEDILGKSVIHTVLSAMDAALDGFGQREMLRYLRSVLSPLDIDVCDMVENYAIVWNIRGSKWSDEWKNHPEGLTALWTEKTDRELKILNEARILAVKPLERLRDGFRHAKNLADQVMAIYRFLEDIQLAERLQALAGQMDESGDNRTAQILNQLWEILISALEQLHDVLGRTVWDTQTFRRLFQLLLSQYDVGTIPPVLDAVQVGSVSAQRLHQQKHLIVLGAQEGSLPGYSGTTGVLTDQERVALRELGVPLTGGNMEGIQAEFAEIYGVFCGAEASVSVYYPADQPSFVCRRLATLAGGAVQVHPVLGAALAEPQAAAAYLVRHGGEEAAAMLGLDDVYDRMRRSKNYRIGSVSREGIDALYGKTLNLSASRIDRQAECRMSYFLKYGLEAKERKEATIDPAEFGTYVHWVLEKTAKAVMELGGFPKVSLEQTLQIAQTYSDEYAATYFTGLESSRLTYLFQRNTRELQLVVEELWKELQQSAFQPVGFEVSFGYPEGLPAIAIEGTQMNGLLRGFIDRVDSWYHNGNSYYRVVDYKTGKKAFDYCDVFNGVGLQMLLYLFALRECGADVVGDNPVPAGVQYFPARVPFVSVDGMPDAEEIEKERSKDQKRSGLLLQDQEILRAMEPGDHPKGYTVKSDGSVSGDLADREQLKMLKAYLFRILGRMVDEIASGNVEPNPYSRGTSHSACAFCPYGTVCHKEQVEYRRNYKAMKAERFWDEIEKEMNPDG